MIKKNRALRITLDGVRYVSGPTGIFRELRGQESELICGPVKFLGHHANLTSDEIQVAVRIRDCQGVQKNLVVSRSDFLNPNRLVDFLVDRGLEIREKKAAALAICNLYLTHPPKKSTVTTRMPGWHTIGLDKQSVYVTNQGAIKPSDSTVNIQLTKNISAGFATSGDLAQWNRFIGGACVGNSRLQFGVCVALASLLLRDSGLPNFGALLYGRSKSGKTVTLRIAASVISDESYLLTWNSTSNALEIVAVQRNDALLPLDEIGQGDPKAVSEAVYDLMNGRTKSRLGSNIKLDSGTRFVVAVLASGEHDLRTHLKLAGIVAKDGQLVRLFSIPVPPRGVFLNLHGAPDVGSFAAALAQNAARYYGTLGPAFISHIAENQAALRAELPGKIRDVADHLLSLLGDIPDRGIYDHVAKSFALVAIAGEIAIANELLTWNTDDATKAVAKCFKAWATRERELAALSDNQVFQYLQRFFQSEKAGKFVPWSEFEPSNQPTLAGYVRNIDGKQAFLVYPPYFETALCKRFGKEAAIRVLKQHDLLILGPRGTPTRQIHIPTEMQRDGQTKLSVYVIRAEILRLSE